MTYRHCVFWLTVCIYICKYVQILGGGFKYFFSSLFKEDSHFDEHIFPRGWKPPTSKYPVNQVVTHLDPWIIGGITDPYPYEEHVTWLLKGCFNIQHTFGTHPEQPFTNRLWRDSFHSWRGGLPGVCSKGVLQFSWNFAMTPKKRSSQALYQVQDVNFRSLNITLW